MQASSGRSGGAKIPSRSVFWPPGAPLLSVGTSDRASAGTRSARHRHAFMALGLSGGRTCQKASFLECGSDRKPTPWGFVGVERWMDGGGAAEDWIKERCESVQGRRQCTCTVLDVHVHAHMPRQTACQQGVVVARRTAGQSPLPRWGSFSGWE